MEPNEYGQAIEAAASKILADYLVTATHTSNPRPWTNREVVLLLQKAVIEGAHLTLVQIEKLNKAPA